MTDFYDELRDENAMWIDRERLARVIASQLGDEFDAAFSNKREWIAARGGEPFRDCNLPYRGDYLDAVSAILADIEAQGFVVVPREPTEAMIEAGSTHDPEDGCYPIWSAMIDAGKGEG